MRVCADGALARDPVGVGVQVCSNRLNENIEKAVIWIRAHGELRRYAIFLVVSAPARAISGRGEEVGRDGLVYSAPSTAQR